MAVQYLEIVSNDVDALTGLYQRLYGLAFGPPDPELGQARVATHADGTLVGIRTPLGAHERPLMRPYLAVDDIRHAVKQAEDAGAEIAYPPHPTGTAGHLRHRDPGRCGTRPLATLARRPGGSRGGAAEAGPSPRRRDHPLLEQAQHLLLPRRVETARVARAGAPC